MAEIIIITALAENNAIGKDGDIPWRVREDFKHFQSLTMGHACVMGDVTYESLPAGSRPLPGRENIVLTFNRDYHPDGATVFFSWEEAMEYCAGRDKIYICGGASVYKIALPVADTLELTRIHKDFDADTFFPEIDFDSWKLVNEEKQESIDKLSGERISYSFLTYKRKQAL